MHQLAWFSSLDYRPFDGTFQDVCVYACHQAEISLYQSAWKTQWYDHTVGIWYRTTMVITLRKYGRGWRHQSLLHRKSTNKAQTNLGDNESIRQEQHRRDMMDMVYMKFTEIWLPSSSSLRRTKSKIWNVFRLVLQLSLPNPLKPGVKSRMKM